MRRRRSLRTRLVVSSVALIAVVCAVIGSVTTMTLHSYLHGQLDGDLRGVAERALRPHPPSPEGDLGFITGPGQPPGTLGARLAGGEVTSAARSTEQGEAVRLTAEQTAAIESATADGTPHTVDIPGAGSYRLKAVPDREVAGGSIVVGLPARGVQDTVDTLIVAEVCVAAAALAAAGLAGTVMIRIALRPLHRVAATATRVSELRLDRGEVALLERVPEQDTDVRTEVGQVGAALNRMLGHVGSALAARQVSETQVRQFVADASHELRTPLASIRGYAELTRRGREETGPDTRYSLGRIESEAARMTTLVEDLLLLARLDAGRPLGLAETDLSPLVVDAVSDARAAGPDHRWRLELPDEPALVRGDPERLHQVLVNLLANARTHTPAGTTVTARVRPPGRGPDGGGMLLEIDDDGPGIPAGLLPHVFERFARGDVSRARAAGSTGLGLAIVQAVVSAHGGRVAVRSAPGRTVFAVHLPAAHARVPQPQGSPHGPSQELSRRPSQGSPHASPHASPQGPPRGFPQGRSQGPPQGFPQGLSPRPEQVQHSQAGHRPITQP
ncbi:ATP-binding protein [Streptomyces sp. NPDC004647]|uniref:sensor histidine kinase n=1 Tax=Streptomyces sp. NPDC004647 TaxID=3154671 RepID=UPI0033B41B54